MLSALECSKSGLAKNSTTLIFGAVILIPIALKLFGDFAFDLGLK